MQGSTGQGNQNGQKQGGLSWTQPPSSAGGMKPVSQTTATPLQNKSTQPVTASANTAKSASLSSLSKKADAKTTGGAGKLASIFLAGVVVGLIVGWGWFSLGKNNGAVATNTPSTSSSSETTSGTTNTNTSATTPTVPAGSGQTVSSGATGGALSVPAQAAGLKVAVSNISVSVPTWVVILDNVDGKPGNALGAQMFFPGQTSGTIELLRATASGQTYLVAEYVDNGDHVFSKQKDTQVNTVAGSQMLVTFKVQ